MKTSIPIDLFIIGGGVNGCGIARDAAGRGLSVTLAEMNDLASGTSSKSTKLFHGGLRYLEYLEFSLVRHALKEREILLAAMPHISWPMRFVLPFDKEMRFDAETPISRALGLVFPPLKGRRPAWLIRLGLFMYDHLGGRKILPATSTLNLRSAPEGAALQTRFLKAFEYSDCWVQDARLVVLNARDAQNHGATILPRTKVTQAIRKDNLWHISVVDQNTKAETTHVARALINAGGPWVESIVRGKTDVTPKAGIRLVKGSHIVTRRLYDHDKCYFFQGNDGRIIFAIPYEDDFTLIGTTEASHNDPDTAPECSEQEVEYLTNFASQYFKKTVGKDDVIWSYAGVRPLYNDGASSATAATREYVLTMDTQGAPLLNVFGGKITTYRRLAEDALFKLDNYFPKASKKWTAKAPLPGGDFPVDGVNDLLDQLTTKYNFLDRKTLKRLLRTYGTDVYQIFADATSIQDLGTSFGAGIYRAELIWAIENEWVQTGSDFLWRRTKLGLCLTEDERRAIDTFIRAQMK